MPSQRIRTLAAAAVALALAAGLAYGVSFYRKNLQVALPDYPPVDKVYWLNQGWDDATREKFHHADQGTQTLGIPYEWFVALEQPRISLFGAVGRLNDPAYLDRFGFIPGATIGGEVPPPIGFAKSVEPDMQDAGGKPWLNPQTGAPQHAVGFTCAACHTGRLTYQGKAVIIDGGAALTDLGKFRQALGLSVALTVSRFVPGRFDRFAANVLGEGASPEAKAGLRRQLSAVWNQRLKPIHALDESVAGASVEEGYGRLDAVNRIGNQVFAIDLGGDWAKKNYHPTSAPVSYPHVWTTSLFDWVQYNASIMQPMVRNAGQALGVGAGFNLSGPGASLYASTAQVGELAAIEDWLGGRQVNPGSAYAGLRAPGWPGEVLPPVRLDRAAQGYALYSQHCQGCHLPPIGSAEFKAPENWDDSGRYGRRALRLVTMPLDVIGTDPAQATDMKERTMATPDRLDLRPQPAPFGPALGTVVERAVTAWYDSHDVPPERRKAMNGDRANCVRADLIYKARPLDGVWATAPFLHNGAVPNVYALLSPAGRRPPSVTLGRREYDPLCMGYRLAAEPARAGAPEPDPETACLTAEAESPYGLVTLDTTKPGNHNGGHAFSGPPDAPRKDGVIGPALKPEERLALIEFLKTDCVNGGEADKVPPGKSAQRRPDTSCEVLARMASAGGPLQSYRRASSEPASAAPICDLGPARP